MPSPTDEQQAFEYNGVRWQNTYSVAPGVCVLPIAEEPPEDPTGWSPVVVLRLHAPYRIRRANYVASKKNNPPVVPGMNDTGSFVFVSGSTTITNVLNTTCRNYDWGVASELLFVENCVSRDSDGFILGSQPFELITTDMNAGTFGFSPPDNGAVAHGGKGATVGYNQGRSIAYTSGTLRDPWAYNTAEFFPGTLVSEDMANGGVPVSPVS